MSETDSDSTGSASSWLRGAAPHLLWLALFLAAFAPTFAWLWWRWTRSVWDNGHGLFMPLILAWLVREQLRTEEESGPESSAWGFAFLLPGLSMLALDAAIQTELMAAAGFVVCLPGLSLLLLGARRTRALTFPLLLSPLMLPIPAGAISEVHLLLREISTWGAAHFLAWIGIPVAQQGTQLLIPSGTIAVSDACSGTQTLYAAVTLSLILAYFAPSTGRRALILVSAWILAILCNMVRVAVLVTIVHYWGASLLDTRLHETSGLVSFAIALTLLFLVGGRKTLRIRRE